MFQLFLAIILITTPVPASSAASSPTVILALGDSLTAGYGLEQEETFPAQLEKGLQASGYAVNVVNAGVSGDTSAGGLARLEWALADQPGIAIVELGANDALRGLDPSQTYKNIAQIVTRLEKAGCLVILAGMKAPRNLGPDYYNRFDQIYPDLAKRYDLLFYPFFLDGVVAEPDLNLADGVHPNRAGVRLIVSRIQPLIMSALDDLADSARQ